MFLHSTSDSPVNLKPTTASIRYIHIFLVSLLLLALNHQVIADAQDKTRYYDIEVLIFEDADNKYLNSEYWPAKADTTDQSPAFQSRKTLQTESRTALPETVAFKNIPPSILNSEAKRIKRTRHYNLLFHGAWTQAGLDKKEAVAIDLQQISNHASVNSKSTLKGTLKIVLARYLHFYADLEYTRADKRFRQSKQTLYPTADKHETENKQQESFSDTQTLTEYYPVKSHRRMRSKTLHYIDHPLVGILVQINPANKTEQ